MYTGLNVWLWYDLSVYLQFLVNVIFSHYSFLVSTALLLVLVLLFSFANPIDSR
jgi:hypothetical protein